MIYYYEIKMEQRFKKSDLVGFLTEVAKRIVINLRLALRN